MSIQDRVDRNELRDVFSICRTCREPFARNITVMSGCPISPICSSQLGADLDILFVSAGAVFCPGQTRNCQYYSKGLYVGASSRNPLSNIAEQLRGSIAEKTII